ncbi:MAG: hypothetical protein EA385_06150 [Salinarimonadaceae bacterium]|nr:MAG: hypothetical protein EA385_06150 [Salinarimonadaceae bacterium]
MRVILLTAMILVPLASSPAQANCLSQGEMREVVASGAIVSPVSATRAAQSAHPGAQVTNVDLCDVGGYIYQMTLLLRDGRVARVVVDGASGAVR